MLLAATNPCPCGYAGVGERCRCGEAELARHRRRLSGPLIDRIDLLAQLDHLAVSDLDASRAIGSARDRALVTAARERQTARLSEDGVALNAHMDAAALRRHVVLDRRGEAMLRRASERGLLSARGQHRVLRVARTIADLDGSGRVRARDLGAAIALRGDAGLAGERAA
jgi:magnesium chelatase family protein